jgi:hypothetical protein
MKRTADFKQKNAATLENLMPADEEDALLNNRVVNVLVDRDQKGRRILVTYNGGKYLIFTLRQPHIPYHEVPIQFTAANSTVAKAIYCGLCNSHY